MRIGKQATSAAEYQFVAKPQQAGKRKYRQGREEREHEDNAGPEAEIAEEKDRDHYTMIEAPATEVSPQHHYFYLDRYDWDLHDFNLEVEPVLQCLVGRCLEQSQIELIEHFEETEYRKRRKEFEIKRHAELMKTQRMDEEHRRLEEEKSRRELQRGLHYQNKKNIHQKLYSRVLAKNTLEGVEEMAMQILQDLSSLI